jgi:hypothetical protein
LDSLDYWRLCDELTIMQAALLIIGIDPSSENGCYCEGHDLHLRPIGYEAAKAAISNALQKQVILGEHVPLYDSDINGYQGEPLPNTTDLGRSMVKVDSLRNWLAQRGFSSGFFFPAVTNDPDYLNKSAPRFAPKLAAALSAWLAVTDPGKRSPKQALEKWLREHAAEFGLVDEDGNPVNTAIEECSKVANWSQGGGAPKMPG